jgi:hypothetical protein
MAMAKIKSLFYKNEHSLSFEKVMEILSKSLSTLDKDPDERYSECQKVNKLLQCIQMPDMEVVAQKSVIASQYANDFLGTCNYFLAHVSHLYGGAQLENSKYKKSVMCLLCIAVAVEMVATVEDMVALVVMIDLVASGGCSGGSGGGGNSRSTIINGINVLDATQNFMDKEWRKFAYNGRWLYVAQAHE